MIKILSPANNSILGEIPPVIFNLSSLIQLDLSSNNLSGSLPWNVHLPNLKQLILQSNHLTGQIFPNLLDCRKLLFLSLWDNEFIGTIPKLVGNLIQLKFLILEKNNMTGFVLHTLFILVN